LTKAFTTLENPSGLGLQQHPSSRYIIDGKHWRLSSWGAIRTLTRPSQAMRLIPILKIAVLCVPKALTTLSLREFKYEKFDRTRVGP
jgi:hypothetical protein